MLCDLFDPLASAQFVTTFSNASPAGVAFTGALRVPASSPRGGRDARLPVQLSAPSSVYGYYTKFSVWLSIMRALSAAARIYHACAICCSSYVPCKCLLLLLSTVFVLSTIRMLPAAARIYRIRAICFCSYLPCVRYLLLLVSTIRMLPPAART